MRARALALSRLDRLSDAVRPLAELHGRRPRDEEVLLELLRSLVVLRRLPAAPADTVGRAAAVVLRAAPHARKAG